MKFLKYLFYECVVYILMMKKKLNGYIYIMIINRKNYYNCEHKRIHTHTQTHARI